MNVYHVSRKDECDYDEFSDFVVVAETEAVARHTHPNHGNDYFRYAWDSDKLGWYEKDNEYPDTTWPHPTELTVKHVGVADVEYTEIKIICSSFHAG